MYCRLILRWFYSCFVSQTYFRRFHSYFVLQTYPRKVLYLICTADIFLEVSIAVLYCKPIYRRFYSCFPFLQYWVMGYIRQSIKYIIGICKILRTKPNDMKKPSLRKMSLSANRPTDAIIVFSNVFRERE